MAEKHWNIPGSPVEIYQNIFVPAMIGEWIPRVLALVDPQLGEKALDVACGTGALTLAVADAVGQGSSIAGADISPEMLNLARTLSDGRFPDIEWRECDAQSLPYADGTFDIAFCQLGLMFMPDKVTALREMHRVLRPGGRLGVMVWGRIEKCPGQMAMAKTWEKLFGAEQSAKFYRQHSMSDPEDVRSYLEAAGFQEIDVKEAFGTVHLPSSEQFVRGYGALGRFTADELTQATAIQEVSLVMQAYEGPDGLVYPIEAVLGKARKG